VIFKALSKLVILLIPFVLLANTALSEKANRVAVRAEATKEYTLARARNESKKVQTYHLIQGKYLGGNVEDPGLEEMTFPEIAEHIGLNLKRQNYYSEEDPSEGDLLIMVHYGASNFIGDPEDNDVFDINDYLPPVKTASGEIYEYEISKNAIPKFYGMVRASERAEIKEKYFRAKILGMDDVFTANSTDYEAFVQEELAREGRYFFILTAFDLPLLKQGEKKVLWTTRYSVRTVGQPYDEALKELNQVAGDYFGKNMKGLISKRATDDSKVEFGDIEVIDGPEETPQK
jgi:hypothetical protein